MMFCRNSRIVPAIGIAVALVLCAAPAIHADPPDAREVTLTLEMYDDGSCSITVVPEVGVIQRGNSAKIKKVYWAAVPNAEYPQLFWELRWDPDKGGGTEDYFGPVDLACGVDSIKVQPDKPRIPNAEWPYAVSAYSCVDGQRAEHLCTVDPRIRWEER
jgi:hypothetical protein